MRATRRPSRSPTGRRGRCSPGRAATVRVNLAVRRTPKPHVTIRYLEPDFTRLFLDGLRGLGTGRRPGPALPGPRAGPQRRDRGAGAGDRDAAAGVQLPAGLGDPAAAAGPVRRRSRSRSRPGSPRAASSAPRGSPTTPWRPCITTWTWTGPRPSTARPGGRRRGWGEPLLVTGPGRAGRAGQRRPPPVGDAHARPSAAGWSPRTAGRASWRRRPGGGPFTAWASVFERTADRIRARSEPRFPHVYPHRLRHSFSMRTLEYLVSGHYRQAAGARRRTLTDGDGPGRGADALPGQGRPAARPA